VVLYISRYYISVVLFVCFFLTISRHFCGFGIFLKIVELIYVSTVDARRKTSRPENHLRDEETARRDKTTLVVVAAEYKAHLASAEHS